MQLIITISILLTAVILAIAGIILLFSPELLIRFNDYMIGFSKSKRTVNKSKSVSIDIYILTRRVIFGLFLIALGLYLVYTTSLLF